LGPFEDGLARIRAALVRAVETLRQFDPGRLEVVRKAAGDPVTDADRAVDDLLKRVLPREGEGWLSEETADDPERLSLRRVWVVDPLDGTREFLDGVPEWCVSIALVVDGEAVAGGICNPATDEWIVGAVGAGVWLGDRPVRTSECTALAEATVLASRSEVRRGEWARFEQGPFTVRPTGSVAYKLALVAAGLADATWTLVPKHEWDVAAGVALVRAAGGVVVGLDGRPCVFNRRVPRVSGLIACAPGLAEPLRRLLT